MKKAVIRILAAALALTLASGLFCALGEGGNWTCENCGQTGNTGNFCSNCGTGKPSGSWECSNCGETGNTGNFCSNCGAAKPAGASDPEEPAGSGAEVNPQLEQIPGETDRVMVCLQGVSASSYIENKEEPTRWVPENAADGNESTCWQFSAKKGLKGKSWISLEIGPEQTVDEIWFKNGFWAYNTKGKDQYTINSRPKAVRVSFLYSGETDYRDEKELTLKDEFFKGWQQFSLGRHEHVTAVKVAVVSIYKGSKYKNDVCLSEAMLVQNAPAGNAKPAQGEQEARVYQSRPDVTGVGLTMKLATRTGPGTEYEEPGTFFKDNWQKQTVLVTGKAWDGSMWWAQVDFQNGKKAKYRAWTGLKRLDITEAELEQVKEVKKQGTLHVDATKAYCGPGTSYAKLGDVLFFEDEIDFYGWENGFVEIDYYDVNREIQRRVWVSEKAVSNVQR